MNRHERRAQERHERLRKRREAKCICIGDDPRPVVKHEYRCPVAQFERVVMRGERFT